MAEIDFCRGMASKLCSPTRKGMSPSTFSPANVDAQLGSPRRLLSYFRRALKMKDGYRTVTCTMQQLMTEQHMPAVCRGQRSIKGAAEPSSMVLGVTICKHGCFVKAEHVTHLIQDGKGHVTNDVGTVDDQSVPLLKADDSIARQVCLLECLQMCQTVPSGIDFLLGLICMMLLRLLLQGHRATQVNVEGHWMHRYDESAQAWPLAWSTISSISSSSRSMAGFSCSRAASRRFTSSRSITPVSFRS